MNRMKCHVRKGDQVEVISGNFRGSSGIILAVFPQKQRVLVEGVRIIKKHLRKSQDNPSGTENRLKAQNPKRKRIKRKADCPPVENGKRISSRLQRACDASAAKAARLQKRSPGSKGRESGD